MKMSQLSATLFLALTLIDNIFMSQGSFPSDSLASVYDTALALSQKKYHQDMYDLINTATLMRAKSESNEEI